MCRWILYAANEKAQLADLIRLPENSLIHQAFSASWHPGFTDRNNAVLNADGVGVAWYGHKPFLYKSVIPAWSDANLTELTNYVSSSVIFGHVRAASPGSVVSPENCHPFRFGRLVFMHNGHIEEFGKVKRGIAQCFTEAAFQNIKGVTDSEHAFGLIISNLQHPERTTPFKPEELKAALLAAIRKLLQLLSEAGIKGGFTSLNFALTDGETILATRFCDKWPSVPPPSLYFCYAHATELKAALRSSTDNAGPGDGSKNPSTQKKQAIIEKPTDDAHGIDSDRWQEDVAFLDNTNLDREARALLVASEPCTMNSKLSWLCMPSNSLLVYHRADGHAPSLEHLSASKERHSSLFNVFACRGGVD